MSEQKRRIMDNLVGSAKRHKVDPDVNNNRELSDDLRMENMEHDIVLNTQILYEVVEQNAKYTDYLDILIKREEDVAEFWVDIKKRLVLASIIGATGLLFAALWFATKEYFRAL